MNPIFYPDINKEKNRYLEHKNDIYDERYQAFVRPLVDLIMSENENNSSGLDFGSGTGPVASYLLSKEGHKMSLFDIFFQNDPEVLEIKYDFILSCEVIEHFTSPSSEFEMLKKCMKPGARLYLNTHMIPSEVDLNNWYYAKDPTHIFFYRPQTFEYIKKTYGFSRVRVISERIIVLDN